MSKRLPIRLRLTLWYVFLLAVTFTAFSFLLSLRFRNSLQSAIDSSLQITVSKTVAGLDEEDFRETGRLTFDHIPAAEAGPSDFVMRLVSEDGEPWDTYGSPQTQPGLGAPTSGFSTLTPRGRAPAWRVYSQPIPSADGSTIGWLQAARSLNSLDQTMAGLYSQLWFGIPILLLLAGAGGYFLAGRALDPVSQMTRTAQAITARDLSRRLDYQGAQDELGRLAHTLDGMLARLQSSFERQRRFTADAAHELRTPLTILKGQIEVALGRPRSPVEYEAKLRELAAQVDRLIRLSNALLFLARSDQDGLPFQPSNLDLHLLLEALLEQFQPLVQEKGLTLSVQLPASLPAHGDSDHLTRLFINLFENAVKYAPQGGEVRLAAGGDDGVWVKIYNSGDGIAPDHLPHLFERFYRVDPNRSSRTGGSGLGLSIAHEIARQHGGSLNVESGAGQGVTVTVRLPL